MGRFVLALALWWAAVCIAGAVYSQQQHIPTRVVFAVIPAFLLEIGFYLVLAIDGVRARMEALPPVIVAPFLWVCAVLPYSIYATAAGVFHWPLWGLVAALSAVAAAWFVVLPASVATDLLFLVLMAGVQLSKVFHTIYLSPVDRLHLDILGQLMWVRTGIGAALWIRKVKGVGFGFLPSGKDWAIGALYFLFFIPPGVVAVVALGFAKVHAVTPGWKLAATVAGTFLGILWVVALSEEFFFRGLLQQWLSRWLGSETRGLVLASILFGSVHLPFGRFPNWKFAIVAAIAGVFYGLAFRKAGSIRASMVTHALVVTMWRTFFS